LVVVEKREIESLSDDTTVFVNSTYWPLCRADGTNPNLVSDHYRLSRADGTLLFQKILSIVEFFCCTTNFVDKLATCSTISATFNLEPIFFETSFAFFPLAY
jgi:hypothetical protein